MQRLLKLNMPSIYYLLFLLILSRTYSNSSSSWVWYIKNTTCHLLDLCYYSYFMEGFQIKCYTRQISKFFVLYVCYLFQIPDEWLYHIRRDSLSTFYVFLKFASKGNSRICMIFFCSCGNILFFILLQHHCQILSHCNSA